METGFFIWQLGDMPDDPLELAELCKAYNIKRLAIKVLHGAYKYNTPLGDDPLLAYTDILWTEGIEVEGWGYHYPDGAKRQGQAIEERRQTLGLKTYHFDMEGEWKRPYGMPAAIKTTLDQVDESELELFICSYRYPSVHPEIPWDAAMDHKATDGATPQIYWALRHDPVQQITRTLLEYSEYNKPVYPIGSTFAASFKWGGESHYWEPTTLDLEAFREYCKYHYINRIYYYSLDWILNHNRMDWLEAATGSTPTTPLPQPPQPGEIVPTKQVRIKADVLNVRSKPGLSGTDLGNLIEGTIVPVVDQSGKWLRVDGWIHEDWTNDIG